MNFFLNVFVGRILCLHFYSPFMDRAQHSGTQFNALGALFRRPTPFLLFGYFVEEDVSCTLEICEEARWLKEVREQQSAGRVGPEHLVVYPITAGPSLVSYHLRPTLFESARIQIHFRFDFLFFKKCLPSYRFHLVLKGTDFFPCI